MRAPLLRQPTSRDRSGGAYSFAKRVAEKALVLGGVARVGRYFNRAAPLILAYHNIVPDGAPVSGDRSLHLSQADFARQLDVLVARYRVVPLDELWRGESAEHRRVALTFDDAYRGALTAGVEELAARDLPATIFSCPGIPEGTAFWWDQLANGFGGVIPARIRTRALWELQGRQEAVLDWAQRRGLTLIAPGQHARAGGEGELRDAAMAEGINVASHTWSHTNLAAIGADDAKDELSRARAWLEQHFDAFLPWVSYPYGLEGPNVRKLAGESYDAALRVEGGFAPVHAPTSGEDKCFRIPRLNVPAGISRENFELRLSGML